MFSKRSPLICKFIMIFLLSFVCAMITGTASYEQTMEFSYSDEESNCPENYVAESVVTSQSFVHPNTSTKRFFRLSAILIFATALFLLSQSFVPAFFTFASMRTGKTVVVDYIHNTDGKKRV